MRATYPIHITSIDSLKNIGEKQGRRDIKDKPSGLLRRCHFRDGMFSGNFSYLNSVLISV
jgi:hypothetical protein